MRHWLVWPIQLGVFFGYLGSVYYSAIFSDKPIQASHCFTLIAIIWMLEKFLPQLFKDDRQSD